MSELGTGIALRSLAATGEAKHRDKVLRWLVLQQGIGDRWHQLDLAERIDATADLLRREVGDTAPAHDVQGAPPQLDEPTVRHLRGLVADLADAQADWLIAVCGHARTTRGHAFDDVTFGPLSAVRDDLRPVAPGEEGQALAITVAPNACGREAAVRGTERLRQALGALYLAAVVAGQRAPSGTRIGDGFPPAIYLTAPGRGGSLLTPDAVAGLSAEPLDADEILSASDSVALMGEILARDRHDLAQERLPRGAAWLQRGFDAISFADAVLALGVALECVIGDESAGHTVENVSRRCSLLLVEDDNPLKRLDVSKQARRLYDWRSRVAHGRFEPAGQDAAELESVRHEFASFVSRVTAAFADKARAERWQKYDDLRDWYELALLR